MINRRTVLVLGAGASNDYSFPLGYELLKRMCEDLTPGRGGTLRQQLTNLEFSSDQITNFRHALNFSGRVSVDAFLEHRLDFLEIGKAAIACELIKHERENTLFVKQPNLWYQYLYSCMYAGFDEFRKNKLAILTFNYDRSIEHYLFTALKNSFRKSDDEVSSVLRSIPIIHLYGNLGNHPYVGTNGRCYNDTIKPEVVRDCIKAIRIVAETEDEARTFGQAHKHLQEAELVCFLGFGYNEVNMKRLKLEWSHSRPAIHGSALGLVAREIANINNMFNPPIILGEPSHGIREFLRTEGILL